MYNHYLASLITLRRDLDNRIDREIENCMNGIEDPEMLMTSLKTAIWNWNHINSIVENQKTEGNKRPVDS